MSRLALLVAAMTLSTGILTGCETGSRDVTPEYFSVHVSWKQDALGRVIVSGETDLPDRSQIDGLVSRASGVDRAVEEAVLAGSTIEVGSAAVSAGKFSIALNKVLSNSCGPRPPCGPFAAGSYLLLVDARTPDAIATGGPLIFDDPRYLSRTHGVRGFTGIEISERVQLRPIQLCIDAAGEQQRDGAEHPEGACVGTLG
ncbi:MAG: hypothetical protein ABR564_00015 [Candidatus Dormibacteria bacterium]